jgi:class 3 adenylate cyclase
VRRTSGRNYRFILLKGDWNMPLYMDRHFVEGATRSAVAHAHELDLAVQEKYNVQFLTYWFDEPRCTAFCLIVSPDKETLQKAHDEAHGLIPNEIIEVDPSVVEAFLGRVKDPTPVASPPGTGAESLIDPAFRAIMFTDLKDSTLMTTTFGDTKALHMLHIHNAIARNALRDHRGREVKHTGDGIMASFDSAFDAVDCATTIQKALADHNQENPDEAMYLRIGISAGEPIEEHGDLFGKAVQLAARVCAHADPGRILVDELVRDLCPGQEEAFSDLGDITPKGFDHAVHLYEVKLGD